eukprot:s3937_g6.t2
MWKNLHSAAERGAAVGEADVAAVVAKAKELMSSKATDVEADIDDGFAAKFLRHFHTPLQPFCAFLGGVCAQEAGVVKVAGKFTPIPGWLHFNALEVLPAELPADTQATGSRYDSLASVFGHSFVQKLQNLKYFMVGCGALGCEFLKNFALNGVCCGPNGLLTVTDADRIELSNLTRQFLFREHNVGQPKSKAASAMAQQMNPNMQVRALEMFVGPKTEEIHCVCDTARFYVDDQCVKYERPLLESGTMGPAGNVDPVVPFKTHTHLLGFVLGFAGVFARNESHHSHHQKEHNEQNYTVGVFLREEGTWSSLEKLAREVSDPRSASYGQYLNQAQLTQRVGIPKADAEAAARSLQNALRQGRKDNLNGTGSTGSTALQSEPGIVTHRDAVVMTVQDFFATYALGQALTENLSNAWPESVHMLVTPPMPDGVCSRFGEEECNKTKPCKWHRKEYIEYEISEESVERLKTNHSQNHSQNHSHQARCTGSFAGWICWRELLVGLRSEAQWHCFEPANFKGVKPVKPVKPSNSSNATEDQDATSSHRATAKRRRRGVEVSQIVERMESGMESEEPMGNRSHRKLFHAVARSGGFGLLTRGNRSLRGCQSLEITFRQDDLVQNRLLKREDFILQGRLHMAAVNSLKNLRPVSDIFVCFNNGSFALAPPGQPGCDCEINDKYDNETDAAADAESDAWGWDNRLGRDCEKVWSFGPSNGTVLPRGAQSLEALYRDLQVTPGAQEMGTQAVAQFNDEAFMQEDVEHLHRAYGLPIAKTVHVHGVRGTKDNSNTGGEGSLDLQTITALAPRASTTWWGVDPWVIDGFMLAYTVDVNNHTSPPLVHSISWGDAEPLYPAAFVQRLDYELMKLALRGITMIVASGDNGNSAVGSYCDFVSDVTSVGATMPSLDSKPYCNAAAFRHLGDCEELGQVTCSSRNGALITSSGYFSVYRPRPKYQDLAVNTFLQMSSCKPFPVCPVHNDTYVSHNELEEIKVPCQHIAKTGCSLRNLVQDSRAAPDVALPGQNYPVVVGDTASTETSLCRFGFRAAPGWDPATGLGVPRFSALQELLPKLGMASYCKVNAEQKKRYRDGGQADEGGGIPMCTLRNFPHLPDHCIEWARDQFELFFVKSVKQLKKFHEDPATFISEIGSSTDMTQSIFEVRGLLSLLNAASRPSVESAGQTAFDFFHLLFRDKILDLTAAFPADARIIDPDTKQDKGLFWSGHKRFPDATAFDVEKETHWRFLAASTALFAAMLGAVPQKQEGDNTWCQEFKRKAWAAALVQKLKVPEYVAGGVNTDGDATASGVTSGAKADSKAILQGLLQQLQGFAGQPLPALEEADFEKDDDFNYHIDFITRCANLRADNYHITNSDFHKVKLVAGRIVPAIATTTAAVCGLVMLELFKLLQGKDTDGFRTRQIGLAVNTYTSFEAQEGFIASPCVEKKVPRAEELPPDAFDDAGKIKAEYILEEAYASYPEKHSVWDKLSVPTGTMTLEGFKDWLAKEHKLKLRNWSFVLGWKRVVDEENKEMRVPVSSQIYPPPVSIDAKLLPPLTDGQADAMKKIQASAAIPPAQKMKYVSEWQKAKKSGKLPESTGQEIRPEMTLKSSSLLGHPGFDGGQGREGTSGWFHLPKVGQGDLGSCWQKVLGDPFRSNTRLCHNGCRTLGRAIHGSHRGATDMRSVFLIASGSMAEAHSWALTAL